MRNVTTFLGIFICFLVIGVDLSIAAEKIELRLRLENNKSYGIQMSVKQNISQFIQGSQLDTSQTMTTGYVFEVQDVGEDGAVLVKVVYKSVSLKQEGPMGEVQYDSKNPPEVIHPAAKGIAAFLGESFFIKLSEKGRVIDLQGVDEMLSRVMDRIDVPEGAGRELMEKALKEQFGEAALEKTMENIFSFYPDEPVGIGDSWEKRFVIEKGFPVILDHTWTLKERRAGTAIIQINSEINPNLEAPPVSMGFMNVMYDVVGQQEGTIEMEESTGWMFKGKLNQEFSGYMNIEGLSPESGQTASWPISVNSVIFFEPLEQE